MKKKSFMQNPVVVIILCIGASGMIYYNIVRPTIHQETGSRQISNGAVPDVEETNTDNEPASDSVSLLTPLPVVSTDTQNNTLSDIGWNRTTTRNPFMIVSDMSDTDHSTNKRPVHIPVRSTVSRMTQSSPATSKKVHRQSKLPLLKAISGGPKGLIALIGTHMVNEGDSCCNALVKKISASTVTLSTPRGTRILRLQKSTQGAD